MQKMFNNLYVLDLANNHFGDLNHAKKIVDKFSLIIKKFKINACIKFQFRDLDTYIHPDFQNKKKINLLEDFHQQDFIKKS